MQQLQQGIVQALIAQKPNQIGVDAVKNVVESLTGGKPQAHVGADTVAVTKDNLNDANIQAALYKSSC